MRSLLIASSLALLAAGCGLLPPWPLPHIGNPVKEMRKVAIAPVTGGSSQLSPEWTRALQDALLKVDGVDRVCIASARASDSKVNPAITAARAGGTGYFELRVLAFDPYYPPSARVEVRFMPPRGGARRGCDVLHLDRVGCEPSAQRAPRDEEVRFQRDISVQDPEVMRRLRSYARCQGDGDRGFDAVDRVVRVSDRFIDFAVYETVRDCFSRIATIEENNVRNDARLARELPDGHP